MSVPISACPACDAAPLAEEQAGKGYRGNGAEAQRLMLSLPQIYCAACISGVERGLATQPGVRSARVNLTLKRATVEADPDVEAQDLADYLTGAKDAQTALADIEADYITAAKEAGLISN